MTKPFMFDFTSYVTEIRLRFTFLFLKKRTSDYDHDHDHFDVIVHDEKV